MNQRLFDRFRYPRLASRIGELADRASTRGLDPLSDLRTVARLLAWALAPDGEVRREIPLRDRSPWARAEVWEVLRRACEGAFGDAHAFAEAIHTHPPSHHFLAENPAPSAYPGLRAAWGIIGVAVLVMSLVAVVVIFWKDTDEPASIGNSLCPECPRSSKLQDLIGEYSQAARNPGGPPPMQGDASSGGRASSDEARELLEEERVRREYVVLRKMYDPAILDERRPYQVLERVCRDRLLGSTTNRLDACGFRLVERVSDGGQPSPLLRSRVEAMKDLYESLFMLRHARAPTSEDHPPWFKKLSGLQQP